MIYYLLLASAALYCAAVSYQAREALCQIEEN